MELVKFTIEQAIIKKAARLIHSYSKPTLSY